MKLLPIAILCGQTIICQLALGQSIDIIPKRVMIDESATLRASGLKPNERVTIRADLTDGAREPWTSQAIFVADSNGSIDVSRQAPSGGSYKEVSAMGLVWSMKPTSGKVTRYALPRMQAIDFHVLRGSEEIATGRLEQTNIGEGVQRIQVRDAGLVGTLFLPAGNDRHPGVLVLGGSEGGLPSVRAAWLASRGYAAFALAYFHFADLPEKLEGIPLEYFGHALAWMTQRPEIDAEHLGVMGFSRGGELSLQLGSMYPVIKTVVAYVPADYRHGACCGPTGLPWAWTWKGDPLTYFRGRVASGPEKARAEIRVENIQGPVMVISGQADGVWESSEMAAAVVNRLKHAHFAYPFEHLKYAHAGHIAGRAEIIPAWQGPGKQLFTGQPVNAGGTPEGNALSSLDAIPKVLAFLRQGLNRPQPNN